MEEQSLKQVIMRELPGILEQDREVQEFILRLVRPHFADRQETESRFDRLLEEMRQERERQDRRWEEHTRQWDEQQAGWNRRWEEHIRQWDEQRAEWNRRWEEHIRQWHEQQAEWNRRWEEHIRQWHEQQAEWNRRWEEHTRQWDEQQAEWNRRWEENQRVIHRMLDEIHALSRKHDVTIGALGARWGLYAEESFRNALKGILEEVPGLEVLRVIEYDDEGEVFGHPDQVELDLIIRDGLLILCEIKSSMSKGDMYIFERKARFYEKRHHRQAARRIVISPMVEEPARQVAERLGILVYSHADDVPPAILGGAEAQGSEGMREQRD